MSQSFCIGLSLACAACGPTTCALHPFTLPLIITIAAASQQVGARHALPWGLILALLYYAEVVVSHIIFFATNFNVPSQAVHVKITAIETPIVFAILLYVWLGSGPLLVRAPP